MYGLKNVRQRHDDALSRVGWDHFESLLAVYYRGQGYEVEHCGTGGAGGRFDGGIDLKLRRPGEYVLVQCKHWNAKQVPHNEVHQLLGLILNEDATGGILVTSGEFTSAARQAATRLGRVRLVEGHELRSMLGPLPERPADRMGGVLQQASAALGTVVTGGLRDHVVSAAGAGLRYHARRSAGRAAKDALVTLGMKLLVAGLFLAIAVYLLNSIGGVLQSQLGKPVRESRAAPTATADSSYVQTTQVRAPAPAAERCREMIDTPSGTYIDHCMSSAPTIPTEEERRELTRKADEAMRVLEASTPEM